MRSLFSSKSMRGDGKDADRKLVLRCQKGDLEAFNQLVEKYRERVCAVAYSVVRNVEDAFDLTQDAFLKVFEKINTFKGSSKFYTWLYRIVYNLAIDFARRKKLPQISLKDQDNLPAEEVVNIAQHVSLTPAEEMDKKELSEAIDKCFEMLPENQRTVLVLRDIQGLSYGEISEIVETSEGTVMSRIFYGRRKVAELIKPYLTSGKWVDKSDK